MQYLVTMDSCKRRQAIEPSAMEEQAILNISGNDLSYQVSVDDTSSSSFPCISEKKSNESVSCLFESHGKKEKRKEA